MVQLFEAAQTITAKDLEAMLRAHYLPETKPAGGIFATEIQDPSGRRRADVIWLPMTTADRGRVVGHEIKVTRADVITELNDPTKADAWLRYCGTFWLVIASPSLIEGLTIPEAWGVMSPPSGRLKRSMTVVKPAQRLKPIDPAPALEVILAWMFYRHTEMSNELVRERSKASRAEAHDIQHRQIVENLQDELTGHRRDQFHLVQSILARMRERDGVGAGYWANAPKPEDVAEVLTDITAARALAQQLRNEVRQRLTDLLDVVGPIRRYSTELASLAAEIEKGKAA
jgi:hypothetical protein